MFVLLVFIINISKECQKKCKAKKECIIYKADGHLDRVLKIVINAINAKLSEE